MSQKTAEKKRIISFDLDMTLLDHKTWRIPESALKAIERLRENSIIVVGSGRDMDQEYSVMYRDMIQPDAMIHMNGTKVTAGGEILFEHQMDHRRMKALLEYCDMHGLSVGMSRDGKDYYTHPEEVIRIDQIRWGESERSFEDPRKLFEIPVQTLVYLGEPGGAKELEKQFLEFKFPLFSGKMGADVVEQEASKAEGLKRLCQYYGIDMEQTIAFGDSMNDYEIICAAGIGVAMGNSVNELKAAADYVTDDIDRDGIWKACIHLGLI